MLRDIYEDLYDNNGVSVQLHNARLIWHEIWARLIRGIDWYLLCSACRLHRGQLIHQVGEAVRADEGCLIKTDRCLYTPC